MEQGREFGLNASGLPHAGIEDPDSRVAARRHLRFGIGTEDGRGREPDRLRDVLRRPGLTRDDQLGPGTRFAIGTSDGWRFRMVRVHQYDEVVGLVIDGKVDLDLSHSSGFFNEIVSLSDQ